jgi:tetratricopeptide (TPR) repeat protein
MSEERYQTAVAAIRTRYADHAAKPVYRERYQDHTAGLRRMAGAIEAMQNGEQEMARKNLAAAEAQFNRALQKAPRDYTAHVLMAKCQYVQQRFERAADYAREAGQIYPEEPQAQLMMGAARLNTGQFDAAFDNFAQCDRLLPGNPEFLFLRGLAREGAQRKNEAARFYIAYLKVVQQGPHAQHAYQRLVDWGFVRP